MDISLSITSAKCRVSGFTCFGYYPLLLKQEYRTDLLQCESCSTGMFLFVMCCEEVIHQKPHGSRETDF
uniref:C2H2-type domain-containing protein n=1 Tax=Steinernema glaseri TaxID=37863 RepID=A0A1I8A8F0_9BILA